MLYMICNFLVKLDTEDVRNIRLLQFPEISILKYQDIIHIFVIWFIVNKLYNSKYVHKYIVCLSSKLYVITQYSDGNTQFSKLTIQT